MPIVLQPQEFFIKAANGVLDSRAPTGNTVPVWKEDTPADLVGATAAAGGTFNLAPYGYDAEGDAFEFYRTGGALDDGPGSIVVLPNGQVTVPPGLPAVDHYIEVDVLPAAVPITTLTVSGTGAWTFGQAFAKEDAPSNVRATGVQVDVRNRWSDGSVKYAVLSGTTGGTFTITTGTPDAGTLPAITTADISASVDFGAYGTATLADAINGADLTNYSGVAGTRPPAGKLRVVATGPYMREEHFYAPASNDTHLAVFWYVRKYSNGAVEVETVVENGWASVAGHATKAYTPVVTVNGTNRYPHGSLTHHGRSRWSRVDWKDAGYTAPVPSHYGPYLRASGAVPNYGFNSPPASAWTQNVETQPLLTTVDPVPFTQGNYRTDMLGGASSTTIGWVPIWEALYCSSSDARAYTAMIGNGRLHGSFQLCYRDERNFRPIKATDWPTRGFTSSGSGLAGVGGANSYFPGSGGSAGGWRTWDDSHHPAAGYVAYLVTGRWYFLEQLQFTAAVGSLVVNVGGRNAVPVTISYRQTRAVAWTYRTITQAFSATPDDDEMRANFGTLVDAYASYYAARVQSPEWANVFGRFYAYDDYATSNSAADWSQFMGNYFVLTLGMAQHMEAGSDATARGNLNTWAQFAYRWPVGVLGDASGWNWRRNGNLYIQVGTPQAVPPSTWYASWNAAYTAMGWPVVSDTEGQGLLDNPYGITASDPIRTLVMATAMAKDHGAAGAVDAWRRLSTSTDFVSQSTGFNADPTYGVMPR